MPTPRRVERYSGRLVLSNQASLDHAGFFSSQSECRPWVTLKLAASIDGKIATKIGDSKWITGSSARHFGHNMRMKHDAIMVGSGTVIFDDPSLNVRDLGTCIQPYRIVLSSNLEIPIKSNLAKTIPEQPVWIFHSNEASEKRKNEWLEVGADLFECQVDNFGLSIKDIMQNLSGEQAFGDKVDEVMECLERVLTSIDNDE